jgi:hypothetical protein
MSVHRLKDSVCFLWVAVCFVELPRLTFWLFDWISASVGMQCFWISGLVRSWRAGMNARSIKLGTKLQRVTAIQLVQVSDLNQADFKTAQLPERGHPLAQPVSAVAGNEVR